MPRRSGGQPPPLPPDSRCIPSRRRHSIEARTGDVGAAETRAQFPVVVAGTPCRGQMQVCEPERSDPFDQGGVRLHRVRIGDVVERHLRRDLDASALVRPGGHELHRQVARGGMELDAIEARLDRAPRGRGIAGDDRGDAFDRRCLGYRVWKHGGIGVDGPGRLDRRPGDRCGAAGQQRRMADACAGGAHGRGHRLPGRDLGRVGQSGRAYVALAHRLREHALADDQSCAGALGTVGRDDRQRATGVIGTRPGHRRHHDAVGKGEAAGCDGGEQGFHSGLLIDRMSG